MDHLFAGVKWKCTACGGNAGTCSCWIKCECGRSFAHSDCDGKIDPDHCSLLADRLEGLLPNLHGNGGGHLGDYKAKTEQFIKGLREAAEANEPLEFH